MKSIRDKLIVYFFVFAALFTVVSISIYFSSSRLMNEYHNSFNHFLVLNGVSQTTTSLSESTRDYVIERKDEDLERYFQLLTELKKQKVELEENSREREQIQTKNYLNLIDAFVMETELAVGFVLLDDIQSSTAHLKEEQRMAAYIQETTLQLINTKLSDYQSFYNDLQHRNSSFQLFILFLFLTTVILGAFMAIRFAQGINKPIQILSKEAKEVSLGNFHTEPINIKTNDELKLLGDSFNKMKFSIRELIEEMKEKSEQERLMKELELKHLQNQINPHFLFNTLNTVSKMAYLEDAKSTSDLIDSVGAILRHSLGDIDKEVTLKDEVKIACEYLNIQRSRFFERIKFVIDLDERCLDIPIPRLTLQPLIENVFIHGIESNEKGGTVRLSVYASEKHIVVEVADDGVGMSDEQIKQVLSSSDTKTHTGHSTGLGLNNVIRRLQLFYHENEIVEIESEIDVGTVIRLLLPMRRAENESLDC
ncbi:HAMP domain-containing protein [Robertmurraya yapensis]|uniref:histidine kinase n=1 Tax=Bacillus yapensis TaxID=2492960 RepID=A0A3S0RG62_9BACI|nr:histidine kinase [Bacillus yapensis]RTR27575.1 HAMP domain-containing protein [Bacillus yapensis]TKS94143.1 HAMP domain-containing protein [Bacillus yapensis]